MTKHNLPLAERFARYVEPDLNSGCHLWAASVARGYGQFKVRPKQLKAHRVSYEMAHGPIPEGLSVCHRCDVKLCVNPDHLFLGTTADNHADRDRKGRQARGERSGQSKLTAEQVVKIRDMYIRGAVRQADIAAQFGVRQTTIGRIVNNRNWR